MAERWTRERRLEHTRSLLLDAAEDVFAEKGFAPATLDDIAHAAGYTKGAIYKHFATKEDLFLAVSDRYWRRYFDNFAEVMSSAEQVGVARTRRDRAARWRQLSHDRGAEHAALGHEFTLYLLRNPDVRERVAGKGRRSSRRSRSSSSKASTGSAARCYSAVDVRPDPGRHERLRGAGSQLDDVDLYRPVIEMYVSAIKLP